MTVSVQSNAIRVASVSRSLVNESSSQACKLECKNNNGNKIDVSKRRRRFTTCEIRSDTPLSLSFSLPASFGCLSSCRCPLPSLSLPSTLVPMDALEREAVVAVKEEQRRCISQTRVSLLCHTVSPADDWQTGSGRYMASEIAFSSFSFHFSLSTYSYPLYYSSSCISSAKSEKRITKGR